MNAKITLINSNRTNLVVAEAANVSKTGDRLGGAEHGLVSKAITSAVSNLDAEEFLKQLDAALEQAKLIADRIKTSAGQLNAKEITLGLAISAEGSIGVATAGAEASIEITFEIKES